MLLLATEASPVLLVHPLGTGGVPLEERSERRALGCEDLMRELLRGH